MVIIQSVRSAIGVFDLEDWKKKINVYFREKAEVEPRTVLEENGRKGVVHGSEHTLIVARNSKKVIWIQLLRTGAGGYICIVWFMIFTDLSILFLILPSLSIKP